ncbi:MAG: 4Fe-4S dicluster domain-containing protein [Myxococcota bacterium]|jgi:NAD-dependent dihydropyrimidine dehydrogenase PreA subunit
MKRKVITINEDLCDGCGLCIPNCPEGALQIIDGKARLVSDVTCDGLGACLGHCPLGALLVEEREAEPYDETRALKNIIRQGPAVVAAHLKHLKDHGQDEYLKEAHEFLAAKRLPVPSMASGAPDAAHTGCPGSRSFDIKPSPTKTGADGQGAAFTAPELLNWPVQLHLINPDVPYYDGRGLIVSADCVPFALPSFHADLLMGKTLIILCPKLDQGQDEYVEKLARIFSSNTIPEITVAHMEVPCCLGVRHLVKLAQEKAGTNIPVKDVTVTIRGAIRQRQQENM